MHRKPSVSRMMSTNNLLAYSTAAYEADRPRRYLSADDAAGELLRLHALVYGCPALDYERLGTAVQTQPSPDNPHLEKLTEIWFLNRVFENAFRRAGDRDRDDWIGVRVGGRLIRGRRDCHGERSRTTVLRNVLRVDGLVEEELARHRRMVQSQSRGQVV